MNLFKTFVPAIIIGALAILYVVRCGSSSSSSSLPSQISTSSN